MKGTMAKAWVHLEGKGNISMKVTPPDIKDSWDSKHPDSSFSKKINCQEQRPEFALGNSSALREIVKDQQLFQVKQTLSVSFYTQTQKYSKINTAQKIMGSPTPFKGLGDKPNL